MKINFYLRGHYLIYFRPPLLTNPSQLIYIYRCICAESTIELSLMECDGWQRESVGVGRKEKIHIKLIFTSHKSDNIISIECHALFSIQHVPSRESFDVIILIASPKWTRRASSRMWPSCHHKSSPDFIIFISFNSTLMMAVISLTDVIKLFRRNP